MGILSFRKKSVNKQDIMSKIEKIKQLTEEEEIELKNEEVYTKQLYAIEEQIKRIDGEIMILRDSAKTALANNNDAEFDRYEKLMETKEKEKEKLLEDEKMRLKKKIERISNIKARITIAEKFEESARQLEKAKQGK